MEAYTKTIKCPFHGEAHEAIVYTNGHKFAGVVECALTGESDSCEHESTHVETTEDWPTSPHDNPQEYQIYVCDTCECTVDGDPAADAYEAKIDAEIDMARGK